MASKTQLTGMGAGTGASSGSGSSWIVVVSAGVAAGLQVWKLPPAIPFLRQDLSLTLVQAGTLLGIIQLAGMLGGLAISLLAELIGERRCLSGGWSCCSSDRPAAASPGRQARCWPPGRSRVPVSSWWW